MKGLQNNHQTKEEEKTMEENLKSKIKHLSYRCDNKSHLRKE